MTRRQIEKAGNVAAWKFAAIEDRFEDGASFGRQ
jgi:hypothetical protein